MMATAKLSQDDLGCIQKLQQVFGNISEDDCRVLFEEFGGSGSDLQEISQNAYEALETSRFSTISELVWHIKQDPSYGIRRSSSMHERDVLKDSWTLARSKSSNTVIKSLSNSQVSPAYEVSSSLAYSGTKNPIQILRSSKFVDPSNVRPFLTKYMQDTEMRHLLYDVYEHQSPKLLILMRGASGSGKTTLASIFWAITENGDLCSADQYFVNRDGEYCFNKLGLPMAHQYCRNKCKAAMAREASPIIIDNTNTRVDEMMPYVEMAVEHNYDIKIVEPKTEWKTKPGLLAQRTVHRVPRRSIEDQLDRFEKTTVKSMVDMVLKRQGVKKSNYKPNPDLDWGPKPTKPPSVQTWNPPSRFNPAAALPLSCKSPSTTVPASLTQARTTVSSPAPSNSSQFSWTEPPPVAPPSPIMLSDLVPDLKSMVGGTTKTKKSAKRNGNTNATATGSGPPLPTVQPVVFEDPAHLEFEKLRKLFPTASKEELERIFNVYEGDVDVCASVLMDEGVEMTGNWDLLSHPGDTTQAVMFEDSLWATNNGFPGPYENGHGHNDKISNSVDDEEEIVEPSVPVPPETSSDPGTADDDTDFFEMVLPADFARGLLSAYGHPDDENRPLSEEELTVKVPADAAFEIYKLLYLNMHKAENENGGTYSSEESTRSNSPAQSTSTAKTDLPNGSDEMPADVFHALATALGQLESDAREGKPNLALIIDIETKLYQQTQESLQPYAAKNRTMAQNINFSMLKQEYPFLDEAVIDEVFIQCYLNVDRTRASLDEMYPKSAAQLKESKTAHANSTWQVKYNPKDVQMYSPEDLKAVQRTYDHLERDWLAQMEKMKDCHHKCNTQSIPAIRAFYMSEAKSISEGMKSIADEMQYLKALSINAKHKNDQILDLHGLKINGAMRVLKEFMQFKEEEFVNAGIPKMILLIITGQGKHSKNGCPVLQPAVRNFLTQRKYRFHSGKPGSYTVILTRSALARRK